MPQRAKNIYYQSQSTLASRRGRGAGGWGWGQILRSTHKNNSTLFQLAKQMGKSKRRLFLLHTSTVHGGADIQSALRKQSKSKVMCLDYRHVRTFTRASSTPLLRIWDGCLRRRLRFPIRSPAAAQVILSAWVIITLAVCRSWRNGLNVNMGQKP